MQTEVSSSDGKRRRSGAAVRKETVSPKSTSSSRSQKQSSDSKGSSENEMKKSASSTGKKDAKHSNSTRATLRDTTSKQINDKPSSTKKPQPKAKRHTSKKNKQLTGTRGNENSSETIQNEKEQHSDSDFKSPSKKLKMSKAEDISLNGSSSESDFEEVVEEQEVKASTSKEKVDFSQLNQETLDIATLAKIEGVQLDQDGSLMESEDDSDWEKVEDAEVATESPVKSQLPDKPVEITLDAPDIMRKKRKKKGFDMEAWFRRQFNRVAKETQINLHKVHLLCLLARGMIINRVVCNSQALQAHALSCVPGELLSRRPEKHNVHALQKLITWYRDWLPIETDLPEFSHFSRIALIRRLQKKRVASVAELNFICVALLRSMGFATRLVFSLQPVTFKFNQLTKGKRKRSEVQEEEPDDVVQLDGPSDKKRKNCSSKKESAKPAVSESPKETRNTRNNTNNAARSNRNSTSKAEEKSTSSNTLSEASESKDTKQDKSTKQKKGFEEKPSSKSKKPSGGGNEAGKNQNTEKEKSTVQKKKGSQQKPSSDSKKPHVNGDEVGEGKDTKQDKSTKQKKGFEEKPSSKSKKPSGGGNEAGENKNTEKKKSTVQKKKGSKQKPSSDSKKPHGNGDEVGEGKDTKQDKITKQKKGSEQKPSSMSKKPNGGGDASSIPHPTKTAEEISFAETNSEQIPKKRRSCTTKLKANAYKDSDTDTTTPKPTRKSRSASTAKKKSAKELDDVSVEEISSGSDFEEEVKSPYFKSASRGIKKAAKRKHKIVSSDSDQSVEVLKTKIQEKGCDVWLEVFLAAEDKWICVDCVHARVDQPRNIEKNATKPVTYVVSYDNDGCVKDVTKRYASDWMSGTRKLRVDSEWWQHALDPFRPLNAKHDEQEELKLQAMLLQKPLPTVIGDFKNHPLYALKRHLLKFEAIYPETAVPLGYVRNEPVYARECVHTLHTRETWLKEGRAVRIGEAPYKIVKGRKKWNKTYAADEEPSCETFGRWQTEVYMPPPVVDGKIPRNEYGNVELFQPWMIPVGAVHLRDVPGLNKVAKKLNVDCASAMIGWDFHGGFNHPMFDGFIVCKEHKDLLLAAWNEEQEIQREREAEKREKRVMNNWKTLIKGLLIKERLKSRFDLEDKMDVKAEDIKPGTSSSTGKSKKGGRAKRQTKEKATDMQQAWPQNRIDSEPTAPKSELFPFEKL